MRVAIMQPYFLPYIGYFQLINAVDKFIIYDNIEYTKKGWINRNRILVNGKDEYITIPLKKDSDYLHIIQREISEGYDRDKLLRKIKETYKKSPEYQTVFPLIERIVNYSDKNLFSYIYNSILTICDYLEINVPIIISSTINLDHALKADEKVIALCKSVFASQYINSIGGLELYSKNQFRANDIELNFLKSNKIEYSQFKHDFVPWLSIVDVLMFNSKQVVQKYLTDYTLF